MTSAKSIAEEIGSELGIDHNGVIYHHDRNSFYVVGVTDDERENIEDYFGSVQPQAARRPDHAGGNP